MKRFKNLKLGFIIFLSIICFILIFIFYNITKVEKKNNETIIKETKTIEDDYMNYNKVIYLTFDDGPSKNTEDLLNILDQYDAKATFFLIGNSVKSRPHLAKMILDRGHSIGMHSYSHSDKIYSSIDEFKNDLDKSEAIFKEAIGFVPRLYRLPYGSLNMYLSRENLLKVSNELLKRGYNYYDWNGAAGDGSNSITSEQIYINVVKAMENIDMPLVLMHDRNDKTMSVIENILQYGVINNYKFIGLSSDSPPVRYTP